MESILIDVKRLIGFTEEYEVFDKDIIIHLNSTFMILRQLGVGPEDGFTIKDKSSLWSDFIPEDCKYFEGVKTYVYAKAKLVFDPPQSSIVKDCLEQTVREFEWRLKEEAELQSDK
mgnify:CR=1 FL=1